MNYKNDYKDKFTVESEQSHAWLEPPSEKSSTKAANHPPATRAAPNHDYNGYAGAPAGDAAPSAAPAAKTSSGQHGAAAVGGSGPSSGLKKHQGKSVAEDKRKSVISHASSGRKESCHHCQEAFVDTFVRAMGRTFHHECFFCVVCQNAIPSDQDFFEVEGQAYCRPCYEYNMLPLCARCNTTVTDRCMTAMNKKFHPQCFVCVACSTPFPGGAFYEKEDNAYCENCFHTNHGTYCYWCSQVCKGQIVTAMGHQWHPECFVCDNCHALLQGKQFYVKNNLPYCELHGK